MIERIAEKAVTAAGVSARQPLNFQLYYGDNAGRAQTINTVYLEDGNPKLDLCLAVFNESSGKITFKAPPPARLSQVGGSNPANVDNCHFSLRLEKDLQLKPSDISVEPNDWQVSYWDDNNFINLYFLSKKDLVLQPKAPDNDSDTVKLIFKNLAAYNGIIKSSNVELTYGSSLVVDSKGEELKPTSSKNAISVTNHPDHRDIPLQFRFIGPNTILNDGTTENSLQLQIINRPTSNNTRPNLLLDKANSKFIVSFEIGAGAEALTIEDRVKAIKLTTTNTKWNAVKGQNLTEGTVNLKENTLPTNQKLGSGETIELDITGIVTNNPSGVSYMYIAYQNIVGYPDGRLVVPIEKTPLLYRDINSEKRVGIGTTSPKKELHVVGDLALGTDTNDKKFIIHPRAGNGDFLQITSDNSNGGWAWERGIVLARNGKVGISLAENARIPQIHLAIGDNDTGLKQEGDNKLAIYTNNAERVRINENGNVGIGTTTPSAKLHVSGGDAIVSGNVTIGTADQNTLTVRGTITSGYSTGELRVNNPIRATAFIGHGAVVTGMIVMWSGQINQIPEGWALCDGNNGRPDLTNRFIVGAGNKYAVGVTGGADSVTLTIEEMPPHTHNYHRMDTKVDGGGFFPANNNDSPSSWVATSSTGGKEAHENRPPYYAMAFIIKT